MKGRFYSAAVAIVKGVGREGKGQRSEQKKRESEKRMLGKHTGNQDRMQKDGHLARANLTSGVSFWNGGGCQSK